jgi:23S rRNA (uracil1939-C5)-methyltransferase
MRSNLILDTTGITHQGYAFAREGGRPVFVAYALPGETVEVHIRQQKRDYAIGQAVDIVQPSSDRSVPPCPLFRPDACGGCQWQHASYAAQLRYKQQIVTDQLRHIGHVPEPPVAPVLPSPKPLSYRTHATFSVNAAGELCFVRPDGTTLQPIPQCLLLRPALQALLEQLRPVHFAGANRVRLQAGSDPDERAILLEGSIRDLKTLAAVPGKSSLIVRAADQSTRVLQGSGFLTYTVAGRSFRATAGGFFQVNLPQAERLIEIVQSQLPDAITHALDLYSGTGLFTALLAERSATVTSVEEYAPAVEDARHNLATYPGVELRAGAVERILPEITRTVDIVVTDPPRAGMKRAALDALISLKPARILYVSCEPSTLARDARLLLGSGYRLSSVQPVDMFPQTYHIESVSCFDLG